MGIGECIYFSYIFFVNVMLVIAKNLSTDLFRVPLDMIQVPPGVLIPQFDSH